MLLKHQILAAFIFFASIFSFSQNEDKEKNFLSSTTFNGLKFRNLGTALVSGRIIDFTVNPNDKSNYYVAVENN